MIRFGRLLTIIMLLFLVGTALNVSNASINQLTMQDRAQVIGADRSGEKLNVYLLGNSYEYNPDKLQDMIESAAAKITEMANAVADHFRKCYKIFCAVFLY